MDRETCFTNISRKTLVSTQHISARLWFHFIIISILHLADSTIALVQVLHQSDDAQHNARASPTWVCFAVKVSQHMDMFSWSWNIYHMRSQCQFYATAMGHIALWFFVSRRFLKNFLVPNVCVLSPCSSRMPPILIKLLLLKICKLYVCFWNWSEYLCVGVWNRQTPGSQATYRSLSPAQTRLAIASKAHVPPPTSSRWDATPLCCLILCRRILAQSDLSNFFAQLRFYT